PIEIRSIQNESQYDGEPGQSSPFKQPRDHATRLRMLPLKNSCRVSKRTGPSRRTTGGSDVRSSTVDPRRDGSAPPSMSASRLSPSCDRTSSAVIVAGSPLLFALVAVIGRPERWTSVLAKAATGHRSPTVPVPAVTFIESSDRAGTTTVSGPGQNF